MQKQCLSGYYINISILKFMFSFEKMHMANQNSTPFSPSEITPISPLCASIAILQNTSPSPVEPILFDF